MDKVERCALVKTTEIFSQRPRIDFGPHSGQRFDAEDGVIEIAPAGAVFEAAVGVLLGAEKFDDVLSRRAQHPRGEPGDLEHFEAEGHGKE